ncbi:energy transducer TonB [Marinimicrobium sp. ARAG 43.8]|uniref:energy transducer TonB n=1 Tax=Marinimicrobium sp. ARAG 43.8 TaxID=3418719 RepID=UPI003CE9F5E7
MWVKYAVSLGAAVVLGLLMFLIMQTMIATDGRFSDSGAESPALNFVRVDTTQDRLETKDRRTPDEPPEPETPPETPDVSVQNDQVQNQTALAMDMPSMDMPLQTGSGPNMAGLSGGGGASLGGFDSDVIPTVKVPPNYPQRARQAKLEGYVTMEVSIRADGTVSDVTVVDAKPPRLFDQAAVQAMQRWRFRPKMVNGEAQPQQARQTIEFKLGE